MTLTRAAMRTSPRSSRLLCQPPPHPVSVVSLGFRFGDLAYSSDLRDIPPHSLPALTGLHVWIVDALRYRPHPTHLSLDEAVAVVEDLRPRRAFFTHIAHDLPHAATCARR